MLRLAKVMLERIVCIMSSFRLTDILHDTEWYSSSSSDVDVGLLQHPRWSALW